MRLLATIVAMVLVVPVVLQAAPQGRCCEGGMGGGKGCCGMQGASDAGPGRGAERGPGSPRRGMSAGDHGPIHELLSNHNAIRRKVEEIPGGVRTTTTTDRPELVETLRTHVRQMAERVKEGRVLRMWDPVFRGIFAHHDEITMEIKKVDGGVEVVETSANPEVVRLIRAHARKVDDFVSRGHEAARPPWAGGRGGRGWMMRRGR